MSSRLMAAVAGLVVFLPFAALTETVPDTTNLYGVTTTTDSTAQSMSGGNQFDLSNNENSPAAPAMPSFAGGPCTGEASTASTSVAGVAIGGGKTSLDDSCQRRNWVQTLLGASQHMNEKEAQVMVRLAVEVMREDPYLAGPMERVGLGSTNAKGFETALKNQQELVDAKKAATNAKLTEEGAVVVSSMSVRFEPTCVVAMNKVPKGVSSFLQAKHCAIKPSGSSN